MGDVRYIYKYKSLYNSYNYVNPIKNLVLNNFLILNLNNLKYCNSFFSYNFIKKINYEIGVNKYHSSYNIPIESKYLVALNSSVYKYYERTNPDLNDYVRDLGFYGDNFYDISSSSSDSTDYLYSDTTNKVDNSDISNDLTKFNLNKKNNSIFLSNKGNNKLSYVNNLLQNKLKKLYLSYNKKINSFNKLNLYKNDLVGLLKLNDFDFLFKDRFLKLNGDIAYDDQVHDFYENNVEGVDLSSYYSYKLTDTFKVLNRESKFYFKNNLFVSYCFNVSSYKLFFNTIILYPHLILNYVKKFSFYNDVTENFYYRPFSEKNYDDDMIKFHLPLYTRLGNWIEKITNKCVLIFLFRNKFKDICNLFKIILDIWSYRLRYLNKTFKKKFDVYLVIRLFYLVVKNRDIHLLFKIITQTLPKVEFIKHRKFFKFLIYMFRSYYSLLYSLYGIKGFQFEFRGKISVGGNSRTRKMHAKIAKPSPSNYHYSTRYLYKTVNTFTGILGLKIWIYYIN